jgi:mRNA interferase MazF
MTRTLISDKYQAYDVVVVPFPYSDRMAEKRRPALVVSGSALDEHGMLWVAMITSAENKRWSCDVNISDLEFAGLPSASVVRTAKIACIEPARVLRTAGSLNAATARKVAARLRTFLAAAR